MQTGERGQLLDQCQAASLLERELWERVRGKHPGQPDHDAQAWQEWIDAAHVVRTLAQAMLKLPK